MSETFEKRYIYKSTLREVYGLTDSMIAELGEPDKRVKNKHYRSGPPANLYHIERVEAWCNAHRKRLDAVAQVRALRQAAAKRANETKFNALIQWAETVPINLEPPASYEEAWEAAERHYAARSWGRDRDYCEVTYGGVLAYMRHELTNYESLLRQLTGRVGAYEAYSIIRRRVDELTDACLSGLHAMQAIGDERHEAH